VPQVGDLIGGKYRLLRTLGVGGMGVVFEALHVATDKQVAIKCLRPELARMPEAAARLEHEARATGRIHHPNVVAVHDCGQHADQLYMVIELLRGKSLRAFIKRRKFGVEATCSLLFPVLRGMAAAHAAGVLHRDLKPENIFLAACPDGLPPVPKVLDFGLARLREGQQYVTQAAGGSSMGTYQYMAPEQLRNQAALDERVDVYALGSIAFEMLAGVRPYRAQNPVDLALQILESEAPLVSTLVPALPHELALVIARSIARDPSARFPRVADFAGALQRFSGGELFRGHGGARPPRESTAAPPALSGVRAAKTGEQARTPVQPSALPASSARATAEPIGSVYRPPRAKESAQRARLAYGAAAALVVLGALTCAFVLDGPTTRRAAPRLRASSTRSASAASSAGEGRASTPLPLVTQLSHADSAPTQPARTERQLDTDWALAELGTDGPLPPTEHAQAEPLHAVLEGPAGATREKRARPVDTPVKPRRAAASPTVRGAVSRTRLGHPSSALKLDDF
jgi:eukaryotic-like serine/threonine-protein kinase